MHKMHQFISPFQASLSSPSSHLFAAFPCIWSIPFEAPWQTNVPKLHQALKSPSGRDMLIAMKPRTRVDTHPLEVTRPSLTIEPPIKILKFAGSPCPSGRLGGFVLFGVHWLMRSSAGKPGRIETVQLEGNPSAPKI